MKLLDRRFKTHLRCLFTRGTKRGNSKYDVYGDACHVNIVIWLAFQCYFYHSDRKWFGIFQQVPLHTLEPFTEPAAVLSSAGRIAQCGGNGTSDAIINEIVLSMPPNDCTAAISLMNKFIVQTASIALADNSVSAISPFPEFKLLSIRFDDSLICMC